MPYKSRISPYRYAGAKNRLLHILKEYIDPLLVNASIYHEPFVGGGSVSLFVAENYPNITLYLNDKDEWVASFYRVIADSNKLKDLLDMLDQPATIEHFYKLNETEPSGDIDMAYRSIFYNRTCFSGIVKRDGYVVKSSPIGGKNQKSKYDVGCRFNSKKLKEKIIYCNKLLSGRVYVANADVNTYLQCVPDNAAMYLDPPYLKVGKQLYNEYMLLDEHKQLSINLKNKSNWVLSYDDEIEIRELYKDNEIIDLAASYCINGKKENWKKSQELIILSS